MKSSRSSTIWPEIFSVDQKDSIVMYEMLKIEIEYSLARNMSFRSNMQYCTADVSAGVNELT